MREHCYFTYIYIGVIRDLLTCVLQHKWKDMKDSHYSCDRLVRFERHQFVQDEIAREKEQKGWSRSKKIVLFESINEAWADLSWERYDYRNANYQRLKDRSCR